MRRTAENHESLRLTELERAADRADFCSLLLQIWGESGCYCGGMIRELEQADYVVQRLRARRAK